MTLWCWSSGLIRILRHSRVFSGSGDFEQTLFQRKHKRLDCGEKQIRSKEQWQWHLLFLNSYLAVEWCCFIENQQRGDLTIDHAWSRSCKSSHSQAEGGRKRNNSKAKSSSPDFKSDPPSFSLHLSSTKWCRDKNDEVWRWRRQVD